VLKEGELVTFVLYANGRYRSQRGRSIRSPNVAAGDGTDVWMIDDGLNSRPRPILFPHEENVRWRRGHVDVSDLIAMLLLEESARGA